MRNYMGHYEFECENKDILASGKCQFSFTYDEEDDKVSSLDIDILEKCIWDVMKEREVQTVRAYHIEDIKSMIFEDVIDYALQHDLY